MWTNANDFEEFANNFYSCADDYNDVLGNGDSRSDLYTGATYNEFSHGSYAVPASDGDFTGAYSMIRRTNLLLTNAENFGVDRVSQAVGEAYFFRAYCYFDLLQKFGDAVIATKPLDVSSGELSASRSDRSEVAAQILSDLNNAIKFLPSFSSLPEGYARVSKEAASAFMSRVALFEGTWQKSRNNEDAEYVNGLLDIAADAALEVMNSGAFQLFGTYGNTVNLGTAAQKYMFILEGATSNPAGLTKADNKEYIFARCFDEIIKPSNQNLTKGCLNNAYYMNRKFVNLYLCDDGLPIEVSDRFQGYAKRDSEFENRDNRMEHNLLRPGVYYFNNTPTNSRVTWTDDEYATRGLLYTPSNGSGYNNQKWATEREVIDRLESYDYPVIRLAEVYLNYAEAVYERDGQISDADLNISLNLVRGRVNPTMPGLSNSLVSANGLDMEEEIRRERTIELYMEGFRMHDLRRWKTAEIEMPQDILGIKWAGTEFSSISYTHKKNADGILIVETGRTWDDKNYLYPLPSDQMQLNPNLGQNPGWDE